MKNLLSTVLLLVFVASAFAAENAQIAAKVNNAVITEKELDAAIDRYIPRATYHGNITEEKRNEYRQQALDELIDLELLYQHALKNGMKADKNKVKEHMEQFQKQFRSKKEYKEFLSKSGLTEDHLKTMTEKDIVTTDAVQKLIMDPARMKDEDVKKYYDENTEKFRQPETAKFRIISTKDEKKTQEAFGKVKAGEDFSAVAMSLSEDKYRIFGGETGLVHRGRMIPGLDEIAFKLKAGETAGPVLVEGVWYIVRCDEMNPPKQVSYEEAKERLKVDLEKKRFRERWDSLRKELCAAAKIEITPR
ncbi:MAG: peptidyl-prolyl cis-trans isomerase [Nitrospiraceae bacterium]|nr:peptidyl-prolyl cis-trans isomerase [Nitrospiraceae bacterium]